MHVYMYICIYVWRSWLALGALGDSRGLSGGLSGTPRDSGRSLGALGDSRGLLGIPGDSVSTGSLGALGSLRTHSLDLV